MEDAGAPTPKAIFEQLARLERSVVFDGSERLLAFLRFVVERTCEGAAATLKEGTIGDAVYTREPPYDPRVDSTVRVEARRLRRKLKEYYATEGHADPVLIELPTGGYVPSFSTKAPSPAASTIFEKGDGAVVAILPFRALSRDPEVETFADGVTDELIHAMGSDAGIRLLSRTTVFRQRIDAVSAIELGVDAVVQGTVRKEGDVLRVTVETSDRRGFIVFSDRFDAIGDDRLMLQEQIAKTTTSRVRLDSSLMRDRQLRPGPVALETMAKVFRARRLLDEQTPKSVREARAIFEDVAGSASDYARGHSGIADAWCDLYRLGLVDREAALAVARPAAARARAIDPQSVEAAGAMATVTAWLEWDEASAEEQYREALDRGENARTARLYAVLLTRAGRHEQAEHQFRAARAMEPFSVQQDVAEAFGHFQARRFDALAQYRRDAERSSASLQLVSLVALGYVYGGERGEAERLRERLAGADSPELVFAAVEIEALLGRPERGRSALAESGGSCFARATLAAAVGDEAACLDSLEEAIRRHELSAVWIRSDIRFDRYRGTPRFERLVERSKVGA